MKSKVPTFTHAVCDECHKPATITKHIEQINDDIQHTYFKCGECGYRTTVCYTDSVIREMLAAQRGLVSTDPDSEWVKQGADRIQERMEVLKMEMEGLHNA